MSLCSGITSCNVEKCFCQDPLWGIVRRGAMAKEVVCIFGGTPFVPLYIFSLKILFYGWEFLGAGVGVEP